VATLPFSERVDGSMRNTEVDLLQVGNNEGEWASRETSDERKREKNSRDWSAAERIKHQE
jgi:hypothetical protein